MEQAAKLYNDYYEGEVDVKPSDIKWRYADWNEDGDAITALIANQFDESPFPIILVKTENNIVADLVASDNVISEIEPYELNEGEPYPFDTFMQNETLAENGYLLVGWVIADSSLIGVSRQ